MRSVNTRYPVDRYLVECSKKFEMVNIIDDEIWNTEPALKPEDEIILRKLHDMLQSTADDLKLLSGELSKFHEPGVQVKTTPMPLDEEFNEKVHIEEIVNAKFHGYKIVDKPNSHVPPVLKSNKDDIKSVVNPQKPKVTNANIQVPLNNKTITNRNLGISRTKVVHVSGNQTSSKTEKLNNGKIINAPAVAYNEYSYNYVESKHKEPRKVLEVQEMPSIHIRSELKAQKVLSIDIIPEDKESAKASTGTNNVSVVVVHHEVPKPIITHTIPDTKIATISQGSRVHNETDKPSKTIRKISKLSTCESSESNNISSDTQSKLKTQKSLLKTIKSSPKNSSRTERKKVTTSKPVEKRSQLHLDAWRNKLNTVYGSSSLNKNQTSRAKCKSKKSPKKSNIKRDNSNKSNLNNLEYIPYSKFTIGGVKASDIEKEISDIPNKNVIPLSPILDRILSSRENSFNKSSPRKHRESNVKILTTSDENLLQEVIDIERTVSETLSKNLKNIENKTKPQNISSDSDDTKGNESYADDFEDDNSDGSGQSQNNKNSSSSNSTRSTNGGQDQYALKKTIIERGDEQSVIAGPSKSNSNKHNLTYTKASNLSFKNQVDIFEFVHSVDTQDSATQIQTSKIITPKETQTSPRNDSNLQPIHNDLWPDLDPQGEVETMFRLEKDLIKKIIAEEYGDLLEKNITKPSSSKDVENLKNVARTQKNTQTSPAHVKHVMTSPTKTKSRTTSPFAPLTVDHHTSPMIFLTNEHNLKVEIEEEEDLAISINLSSPRFSLRLPRNSREVLSNLGDSVSRVEKRSETVVKNKKTSIRTLSTSSIEADSSDISSLGEVRLRRKLRKFTMASSDSESCSTSSKCSSDFQSGILPLRSEGEMSFGRKKNVNKNKSEGEASFGQL